VQGHAAAALAAKNAPPQQGSLPQPAPKAPGHAPKAPWRGWGGDRRLEETGREEGGWRASFDSRRSFDSRGSHDSGAPRRRAATNIFSQVTARCANWACAKEEACVSPATAKPGNQGPRKGPAKSGIVWRAVCRPHEPRHLAPLQSPPCVDGCIVRARNHGVGLRACSRPQATQCALPLHRRQQRRSPRPL